MNNWKYVPFKQLFDWEEKSKIKSGDGKQTGKYKMFVCSDTEIKRFDDFLCDEEALVFGTGGKASCHYIFDKFAYSTDCIVAKSKFVNTYVKFYYYYLRRKNLSDIQSTFSGSGLQHTSKKKIENILIPLIEFEEQKRIVNRIEELFSELDAGIETLKKTKAQLEVYRQAVLKEAFSKDKIGSTIVEIKDLVEDIRIGPFGTMLHKSDYISGGIPVINPQHIKNSKIIPNLKVTVTNEKGQELKSYRLRKNDIIMGRRGEMGRCAPVTEIENSWICGTGSIRFRLKPEFDAVFYSKILSSPDVVHYLEEKATGTTMKNLNEEIVQHIPVPYMTIEMQKKATTLIAAQLSSCDSIELTVETTLQQAEALRQSILKKAFEGNF